MRIGTFAAAVCVLIVLSGCTQKASWHADEVKQAENPSFTVGEVQRNIHKGMTNAAVAEALGSPNVVSTDEEGREVWIYDRFHTEQVVSASNGITLSLSNVAGGASRTSQSTITVIIKYDHNKKVRDVAYHQSRF
ncbi:MAG: hypothetical protein DHS20C02_06840 [Micavibrio sp.]|nr:MAG: hypothetical protein DHS20C02_06840 [Micavibrio sp.]